MILSSAQADIQRLKLPAQTVATIKKLFADAKAARKKSYSPYSRFAVGAALVLNKNAKQVYTGANIENSSYGATVCGERVAIWKAVSENRGAKVEVLVLVTDTHPAASPCGICRQVLQEFSSSTTILCQASLKGVDRILNMNDLLPGAFDASQLP